MMKLEYLWKSDCFSLGLVLLYVFEMISESLSFMNQDKVKAKNFIKEAKNRVMQNYHNLYFLFTIIERMCIFDHDDRIELDEVY